MRPHFIFGERVSPQSTQSYPRLSDVIQSIGKMQEVTCGSLVAMLGPTTFGALMLVFAVPNIIPTPPGTSAILGLPLLILTFQLMLGRQNLWLPEKIKNRRIDGALLTSFVKRTVPVLRKLDFLIKPRLFFVIANRPARTILGFVCLVLAIILFLPVPLGNIMPAFAIAILSIALAERDGVLALIGYGVAIGSCVMLFAVYGYLFMTVKSYFF